MLGPLFATAMQARRSSALVVSLKRIGNAISGRRRWAIVVCAMIATMITPLPFTVRCDCELQPKQQRVVAAPFNAVWRQSHVRPGDFVTEGQPLGLLDSSELLRELAAATADRDRAAKSSDVNAAAGKTAAAQIDRLEVRRVEERRSLLMRRLENIELKSPITGIVMSGEWERAEGAPIKQGTVLYEIAPLDRIVVETFVAEGEIERLRPGSSATVVLDARPYENYTGTVERIYPRAEIHDDANVFIIEITLDNPDRVLRPGMKGHVYVETETRSIAKLFTDRFWPTYAWMSW
ncbi:MAG: efflux RND transporter periplasmic adaptor subunit [Planctomycetia bacterium]|nr:efflux RND transporter periplasmic adaptor subunit [Planctomycetia bacterium]